MPAAVGLAMLAEPLLATLFLRGEFTQRDVEMAAASLRAYAPGLLGFILVKVLAPGYFARQDTRTPVRVGLQALTLGMVAVRRVRARACCERVGRPRTPASPRRRRARRWSMPRCCSRDFGGRASIAPGPVGRRSRGASSCRAPSWRSRSRAVSRPPAIGSP